MRKEYSQCPTIDYTEDYLNLLNADVNYMAILLAKSISDFTNLDFLVDLALKYHLELSNDKTLNKEIRNIIEEKFTPFSRKIKTLDKIASYARAENFKREKFIKCAGDRNNIAHGYYRVMNDKNDLPVIYVINKTKLGELKISRPEELANELHNSIKQCAECMNELFQKMNLPKFGEGLL